MAAAATAEDDVRSMGIAARPTPSIADPLDPSTPTMSPHDHIGNKVRRTDGDLIWPSTRPTPTPWTPAPAGPTPLPALPLPPRDGSAGDALWDPVRHMADGPTDCTDWGWEPVAVTTPEPVLIPEPATLWAAVCAAVCLRRRS
jgi:hypothetical protein